KLIDFGLAKPLNRLDCHSSTTVGALLGTPFYMSPEQLDGTATLTPASDVYSFGCVLYEMLVGDPPHNEESLARLINARFNAPVNVEQGSIPEEIRPFLQCTLQRAVSERYATGQAALKAFIDAARRAEREIRHGRYRAAWVAILESQLLEQYAA